MDVADYGELLSDHILDEMRWKIERMAQAGQWEPAYTRLVWDEVLLQLLEKIRG